MLYIYDLPCQHPRLDLKTVAYMIYWGRACKRNDSYTIVTNEPLEKKHVIAEQVKGGTRTLHIVNYIPSRQTMHNERYNNDDPLSFHGLNRKARKTLMVQGWAGPRSMLSVEHPFISLQVALSFFLLFLRRETHVRSIMETVNVNKRRTFRRTRWQTKKFAAVSSQCCAK